MKKLCVILALIIILTGCAAQRKVYGSEKGEFTLLWYVNGSDLESGGGEGYGGAFSRNLSGVLDNIPPDDRLSVVIFAGGTEKWETEGFEAGVNQVHFVTSAGLEHGPLLEPGSIASPETLAGFIDYAIKAYPARRYGLIFWDHGNSAPVGFGLDESSEPKSIDARTLSYGLRDGLGGEHLSFVGFDACLMATAETAAACAPYADYLIASEELEPNAGWNYSRLMDALGGDPGIDTLELGKIIVDSYFESSLNVNEEEILTLSVTDLSKVGPVITATEEFARAARADLIEGGFLSISRGRAGTKYFGGVGESSDMVDLVHLAQRMAQKYPEQSSELIDAVSGCVAYNRRSENSPHSNGLSVYFPLENEAVFEQYLDVYLDIGFSRSYIKLVEEFSERLRAGESENKRLGLPVNRERDGRYSISIPDWLRERTASVCTILAKRESGDVYYICCLNPDVSCDGRGGVSASPSRRCIGLNGEPVFAVSGTAPGGRTLYSVPALVNGSHMKLLLEYENSVLYLSGATPDGNEDAVASPGIVPLVPGDRITPKHTRININSAKEEDGFAPGREITVPDSGAEPGFVELPPGRYYFGFYLTDLYDNHFLSDMVSVSF